MGEEEMSKVIGQKYVIDRNGKGQRKSVKKVYLADSSDKSSMFPVFGRLEHYRTSSSHWSLPILVILPAFEFLFPNGRSSQPVMPWYSNDHSPNVTTEMNDQSKNYSGLDSSRTVIK